MAERMGLKGGRYRPLTSKEMESIHQTSLRVFQEVGIAVNYEPARDLFKKAGARIDESSGNVFIPSDMVEELVGKAPSIVTLCGRDPSGRWDCAIGDQRVYVGTGGTALNVQDSMEDGARPAGLEDVAKMAWMVEHLGEHPYLYA